MFNFTTFVGQNYGAGKIDRVKKTLYGCQFLVIITGLVLGIGAWFFGEPLLSIYASEADVIQAGMVRLGYVARFYFLCGIMDVMVGSLRGLGYSIFPMIMSLIGACLFRLLWIYFIFPLNPIPDTVYVSYPITWIITITAHILTYIYAMHKIKKKTEL